MMVFKRKQVVVLSLVLMILVAGYLQYNYSRSSVSTSTKDNGKLGEAVYVDSKDTAAKDSTNGKDTKNSGNKKEPGSTKTSSDIKASQTANDYFAQAKLEKELTRGKNTDALRQITEDVNADKETKAKAYDQMTQMIANAEKEMKVENLIKDKGFADVIAFMGEDGSFDIIVKAPTLTASDTAKITDVVSRQAKVKVTDIHISNLY